MIKITNGEKIETILNVDRDCTEVHGENGTMTFTVTQDWWNAEYKDPTTKNDLGVDCIDRNSIKYYPGTGGYMYASKGEIDKLPSVTPQEPKIGHWIDNTDLGYHVSICSNCNWRGHGDVKLLYKPKFCPNCGSYNGGASNGNE